jgi:hypothetical protein
MLGAGLILSTISLLAFVAMPTVIGCMLVLWKDVTLVALVMLSISMIFWVNQSNTENTICRLVKWLSLLLLMIGTLVRFNAITSTSILAIYWLAVFYRGRSWKFKGVAFFLIIISMVAGNKVINNYNFPYFQKLAPNNVLYSVMANDLIGISGWSRVSLIPFDSAKSMPLPKVPISDIDNIYSSLGSAVMYNNNVTLGNRVKVFPEQYTHGDIVKAWLNAVATNPMAYIKYRLDLFSEIIGSKNHETYEPTHFNRIDENKFGIKFEERSITNFILRYIKTTSNMVVGKPWFVFLLSFFSMLYICKSHLIGSDFKRLSFYTFAAAFFYIIPFLIIPSSGEVRYSFPAIVFCFVSLLVMIFSNNNILLRIKI